MSTSHRIVCLQPLLAFVSVELVLLSKLVQTICVFEWIQRRLRMGCANSTDADGDAPKSKSRADTPLGNSTDKNANNTQPTLTLLGPTDEQPPTARGTRSKPSANAALPTSDPFLGLAHESRVSTARQPRVGERQPSSLSGRPPTAPRSAYDRNTPAGSRSSRGDMLGTGMVGGSGHNRRMATMSTSASNISKIQGLLGHAVEMSHTSSSANASKICEAQLAEKGVKYVEYRPPANWNKEIPHVRLDATSAVVGSQLRTAARIERVVSYLDSALVAVKKAESPDESTIALSFASDDPEFITQPAFKPRADQQPILAH